MKMLLKRDLLSYIIAGLLIIFAILIGSVQIMSFTRKSIADAAETTEIIRHNYIAAHPELSGQELEDKLEEIEVFTIDATHGISVNIQMIDYSMRSVTIIIIFSVVLFRMIKSGVENRESGRNFLETIPVSRRKKVLFPYLAETVTIVLACSAGYIMQFMSLKRLYDGVGLELPLLGKCMINYGVLSLFYIIAAIAVLMLIETVIVNGVGKLIGDIVFLMSVSFVSGTIYSMTDCQGLPGGIYRFLSCVVGELCFGEEDMLYSGKSMPVIYQGNSYNLELYDSFYDTSLINCMSINDILPYVIGYAVIAAVAVICSVLLYCKRDLSKKKLYYSGAAWLAALDIGALFAGIMLLMYNSGKEGITVYNVIVTIFATIAVAVFVLNKLYEVPFIKSKKNKIEDINEFTKSAS